MHTINDGFTDQAIEEFAKVKKQAFFTFVLNEFDMSKNVRQPEENDHINHSIVCRVKIIGPNQRRIVVNSFVGGDVLYAAVVDND